MTPHLDANVSIRQEGVSVVCVPVHFLYGALGRDMMKQAHFKLCLSLS